MHAIDPRHRARSIDGAIDRATPSIDARIDRTTTPLSIAARFPESTPGITHRSRAHTRARAVDARATHARRTRDARATTP